MRDRRMADILRRSKLKCDQLLKSHWEWVGYDHHHHSSWQLQWQYWLKPMRHANRSERERKMQDKIWHSFRLVSVFVTNETATNEFEWTSTTFTKQSNYNGVPIGWQGSAIFHRTLTIVQSRSHENSPKLAHQHTHKKKEEGATIYTDKLALHTKHTNRRQMNCRMITQFCFHSTKKKKKNISMLIDSNGRSTLCAFIPH